MKAGADAGLGCVCGNDCYIMGPPGDLCAALLGRNWSFWSCSGLWLTGNTLGRCVQLLCLSPGEVMLTKQSFEFPLPAGRCRSCEQEGELFNGKAVQGGWMLEALWKIKSQHNNWLCFSHVALNRSVITPNPVYNFYWLFLVFLHTGKDRGRDTAAWE